MNDAQLKLAIATGLKLFAPGSNVTGIDMADVAGAEQLRRLLVLIGNGSAVISPAPLPKKEGAQASE